MKSNRGDRSSALARHLVSLASLAVSSSLAACDAESEAPTERGVGPGDFGGDGDTGVLVVNTDRDSSSVSVVLQDGTVASPVLISSGSEAPGLSGALSGDVVLPISDLLGSEAILIDRSNGVLTFVSLEDASVRGQLDVGTGFDANPHDYLPVGEEKAYVTRFATNGNAGTRAFDGGDDLLIVDPVRLAIVGSIDLSAAMAGTGLPARPEGGLLAGGLARVSLLGLSDDFSDQVDARVVSVDPATDEVVSTLVLNGIRNCTSMARSPSGGQLALGCAGTFAGGSASGWPDAAVVLLDVSDELTEVARLSSEALAFCPGEGADCLPAQPNGVAYLEEDRLLVTTFGARMTEADGDTPAYPGYPAQVLSVAVGDGEPQVSRVLTGGEFDVGPPECFGAVCFVPDAGVGASGILHRLEWDGASFEATQPVVTDAATGLPPRQLQRF